MSTVKVHKAKGRVGLAGTESPGWWWWWGGGQWVRGTAGGGGMKHVFSVLIPISYIRHIFLGLG